ncbi:receptor activity-modifying protein 1-like [Osmerus mordax]|uniref:receptor activity-modifying protein 1-like n=1 Tax=Osmerus mordax TaxID=8014 RepID=UPI00350F58AA
MTLDWLSTWKLGIVLCAAAHGVHAVSGCSSVYYESVITEFCLTKFTLDMEGLDPNLWCNWPQTLQPYGELTNCTFMVAWKLDCFWPNHVIDQLFVRIHQHYFHNCSLTGRLLHDPPLHILGPFIAVPVLITLLMTALVVWRSKRSKGVL